MFDAFSTDSFMPHGHCFLWKPWILWTRVVSDIFIALAYAAIPLALWYFVKKRKDLPFQPIWIAFSLFIFACGAGHVIDIVTLWNPIYGVQAVGKAVTAMASVATAAMIFPMIPKALAIPKTSSLHEANKQLKRVNERYAILMENSGVGVFEWWPSNGHREQFYWSKSLYRILGVSEGQELDWRSFIERIEVNAQEQVKNFIDRVGSESKETITVQSRSVNRENRERWIRISAIRNEFEGHSYIIGSMEDISNQMQNEISIRDMNETLAQKIQERTKQLEEANKTKSRFLANMSHEIRTPLGLVLGFAELLQEKSQMDDDAREYVRLINKNGTALYRIINDILDLSKVEAGKLEFIVKPLDLSNILEDAILSFTSHCKAKGIELIVSNGIPEEHRRVHTDEVRLRQVYYNLISNAIKNTDSGSIHIQAIMDENLNYVIEVTHTGTGIPTKDHQRIFTEYTQSEIKDSSKRVGTGLGLRLSRKLAQALGGNVYLKWSKEGEGSCFAMTFSDLVSGAVTSKKVFKSAIGESVDFSAIKVMVLDDIEDNVALAKIFVSRIGCKVEGFTDPDIFLVRVREESPHLILLDIQMPKMDGFEVFNRLRAEGYRGEIWALTAYALNDDIEKIKSHGFDSYLRKPLKRSELKQRISNQMGGIIDGRRFNV